MWQDPYDEVRIDVVHALGKIETPESLEMLKKMSHDPDKIVREEALRYLKLQTEKKEPCPRECSTVEKPPAPKVAALLLGAKSERDQRNAPNG